MWYIINLNEYIQSDIKALQCSECVCFVHRKCISVSDEHVALYRRGTLQFRCPTCIRSNVRPDVFASNHLVLLQRRVPEVSDGETETSDAPAGDVSTDYSRKWYIHIAQRCMQLQIKIQTCLLAGSLPVCFSVCLPTFRPVFHIIIIYLLYACLSPSGQDKHLYFVSILTNYCNFACRNTFVRLCVGTSWLQLIRHTYTTGLSRFRWVW